MVIKWYKTTWHKFTKRIPETILFPNKIIHFYEMNHLFYVLVLNQQPEHIQIIYYLSYLCIEHKSNRLTTKFFQL